MYFKAVACPGWSKIFSPLLSLLTFEKKEEERKKKERKKILKTHNLQIILL